MLFDSSNLAWPHQMQQLFNAHEAVSGFPDYLFSFSCLHEDESEVQTYYRKLIVLSCLQPLLIAASCSVWLGVGLWERLVRTVRNEVAASAVILFFTAYPV